jgi:hypothetical protein
MRRLSRTLRNERCLSSISAREAFYDLPAQTTDRPRRAGRDAGYNSGDAASLLPDQANYLR